MFFLDFMYLFGYNINMYKAYKTDVFSKWHDSLKDLKGKIAIARRIDRAENGNLGDSEPVGSGVFEMRIDFGPGYRVYYIIRNGEIIILLCGGDKSSQKRDIDKAKEIAQEYK
jgi:putative addiction module killer protein